MQSIVMLSLLFLTAGNAFPDVKVNNYMDNFLGTAFSSEVRSLQLDPATLPDFDIEFEEQIRVFGKVKGKAEFKEGNLEGLSEARRLSDCHGRADSASRILNCTIAFDKLKVRYEGKLKYGRVPKLGIKGKAKVSDTHYYLEIVQQSPGQPILRNYTCTQEGAVKVKFTGLGPLNRFMNVLEVAYLKHVQTLISGVVSQKLQYAMNRALSKDLLMF